MKWESAESEGNKEGRCFGSKNKRLNNMKTEEVIDL